MAHPDQAQAIRELLASDGPTVAKNTRGFNDGRYASVARLEDYDELKRRARAIKEDAIERLPELIDQVRAAVEARGGAVYVADDAAAANRYIAQVTEGARRLVKSKSMTSEEIEVNAHLEAAGIEVVETDLGEWVLQLANEQPSHLVAPALHKSRASIAELFRERFAPADPPETAEELTQFARDKLWALIKGADVGMTGANFITADTGTIALVTSEGNARKTALIPPTFIAVAGIEKIIPSVEDLQPFVELIGRSGTGQDITSYISLLTPPFHTPPVTFDADGAPQSGDTLSPGASAKGKASNGHTSNGAAHASRSFHLVLIDNGRRAMRADRQLRETLYCIRCGACANVCANFQQVGGHAFGGTTYTGGIATGWEAGVHGLDAAASFNDLCTGCSRCVPACPVQIDIPWINVVVRDRIANGHDGAWRALPEGLRGEEAAQQEGASGEDGASARQAMQRRLIAHFGTLAKWGSRTAPVSNWVSQWAPARMLMERLLGIDRRRALPQFQRETLQDWMRRRLARNDAATHDAATHDAATHDAAIPGSVTNGSASSGSALDRPRASRLAPPRSAAPDVVLYPDTYTNYVDTPRGQAAIRTLEALGVRVAVPDVPASGRAALSQGMIGVAEGQAQAVYEALDPYLRVGTPVIVIEPSDLAMFQGDYQRLLPDEAFAALSAKSVDLMAFIHDAIEDRLGDVWASHAGLSDKFVDPDSGASGGASVDSSGDGAEGQGEDQASPLPAAGVERLTCGAGQAVTYHSHCQQRTLGLAEKTVALLDHLGYKVTTTTMECCGMAGSFGYKADYYELSMQIGQDLYREMTSEGRADAILVASGTSCQEQVEAFAGRRIPHPIELIAPAE